MSDTRPSTVRAVDPGCDEGVPQGAEQPGTNGPRPRCGRAIQDHQQALRLDPTFAPAHAALADCYNQLGTVMVGTGSPARFPAARGRRRPSRRFQIDANLARGARHTWLRQALRPAMGGSGARVRAGDPPQSELRAGPHLVCEPALGPVARRFAEAVREVQLARDLDPVLAGGQHQRGLDAGVRGPARRGESPSCAIYPGAGSPPTCRRTCALAACLQRPAGSRKPGGGGRDHGEADGGSPPSLGMARRGPASRAGRRAEARALLQRLLSRVKPNARPAGESSRTSTKSSGMRTPRSSGWRRSTRDTFEEDRLSRSPIPTSALIRSDPRFGALLRRAGLEGVR